MGQVFGELTSAYNSTYIETQISRADNELSNALYLAKTNLKEATKTKKGIEKQVNSCRDNNKRLLQLTKQWLQAKNRETKLEKRISQIEAQRYALNEYLLDSKVYKSMVHVPNILESLNNMVPDVTLECNDEEVTDDDASEAMQQILDNRALKMAMSLPSLVSNESNHEDLEARLNALKT